jgi:hypothetical protein
MKAVNWHEANYKINEVKAIRKMKFPQEAMDLLHRLVKATQALMIRQKWSVGSLLEFFPSNPNLLGLNVNAGERIMIRLRDARNNQRFLPWESLLGTMIHELVHNDIGAHNSEFYQLVDKYSDEVQIDMLQSMTSMSKTPFNWSQSTGYKLGTKLDSTTQLYNQTSMISVGHKLGGESKEIFHEIGINTLRIIKLEQEFKQNQQNSISNKLNKNKKQNHSSNNNNNNSIINAPYQHLDKSSCSANANEDLLFNLTQADKQQWYEEADVIDLTGFDTTTTEATTQKNEIILFMEKEEKKKSYPDNNNDNDNDGWEDYSSLLSSYCPPCSQGKNNTLSTTITSTSSSCSSAIGAPQNRVPFGSTATTEETLVDLIKIDQKQQHQQTDIIDLVSEETVDVTYSESQETVLLEDTSSFVTQQEPSQHQQQATSHKRIREEISLIDDDIDVHKNDLLIINDHLSKTRKIKEKNIINNRKTIEENLLYDDTINELLDDDSEENILQMDL